LNPTSQLFNEPCTSIPLQSLKITFPEIDVNLSQPFFVQESKEATIRVYLLASVLLLTVYLVNKVWLPNERPSMFLYTLFLMSPFSSRSNRMPRKFEVNRPLSDEVCVRIHALLFKLEYTNQLGSGLTFRLKTSWMDRLCGFQNNFTAATKDGVTIFQGRGLCIVHVYDQIAEAFGD
jgi:hypothetical protein